jgi:hypothetical protein
VRPLVYYPTNFHLINQYAELRYRELYRDCKEKDYKEAERYYERASFLFNSSGHPHNQVRTMTGLRRGEDP